MLAFGIALGVSANASKKEQYYPCLTQCYEHYKAKQPMKEFKYFEEEEGESEEGWGMAGAFERSTLRKELRELEECSSKRSVCWGALKRAGSAVTGADRFTSCHDTCIQQFREYLSIK